MARIDHRVFRHIRICQGDVVCRKLDMAEPCAIWECVSEAWAGILSIRSSVVWPRASDCVGFQISVYIYSEI